MSVSYTDTVMFQLHTLPTAEEKGRGMPSICPESRRVNDQKWTQNVRTNTMARFRNVQIVRPNRAPVAPQIWGRFWTLFLHHRSHRYTTLVYTIQEVIFRHTVVATRRNAQKVAMPVYCDILNPTFPPSVGSIHAIYCSVQNATKRNEINRVIFAGRDLWRLSIGVGDRSPLLKTGGSFFVK